jgi:HD-GYP domain-containing protein (c-di-GMP phosphodiesterase class II)
MSRRDWAESDSPGTGSSRFDRPRADTSSTTRRRTDGFASDGRALDPADGSDDLQPSRRLMELGRRYDRSGRLDEAIKAYEAAVQVAQATPADGRILAEALRRLAVTLNRRGESLTAHSICQRSYEVASAVGDIALRAEALNTLGGLELMRQCLDEARQYLERALELSRELPDLQARIEQNLGILCNIRDDRATALEHYERSLQAFRAAGNDQGCAIAYHNLGMVSADQKQWEAADQYFEQGRRTAQEVGDDHLRGLCLMNRVEVLIALRRFDAAQLTAETALAIFEELHAPAGIADVQRMLGIVFRETGRPGQAQSRLELAVELAGQTASPMSLGEALRETALLHCQLGHLDLAVDYLSRACRQFSRVPVPLQGPEVVRGEYPNFVRDWCELVRAVDPETADHADRVAAAAVAIAQTLGLSAADQAAVRLAGQLHEVGVLRLVRETVAAGPSLKESERRLYQSRSALAAELLAGAECFDGVVPIVRTLDEHPDGSGYPDGLRRDAIPLGSQILSLVDMYDRLVRGHRQRAPMPRHEALVALARECRQWRADVHDALVMVTAES